MELTQLNMAITSPSSPVLMIGEFVFDDQLVIKDVCLCKSKYGRYFVKFPDSNGERVSHPINQDFYQYLLSETLADYHKKRSILGRNVYEEKGCKIV